MEPTDRELSLTFVGTATTLVRYGALTLLTDPNFLHRGQYAWLGKGLVSRRLTEPALQVGDLPELDAVVLSHLHGDHFDRVARRGLARGVPILTTPHARRRLAGRAGFTDVTGLAPWESRTLRRGGVQVRVTAAPGRHAPGPWQRLLPPVMGSVWEFGPVGGPVGFTVYVSGDTLNVPELREIPMRHPHVDLAVLHLGGTTLPGGLVVTMDGVQGADLLQVVEPAQAVPVHVDDYGVFRSPLSHFRDEVERRGLGGVVRHVARGETAVFAPR
ncbi:MBL fold metallo-hydrolase [Kineococcus indalonis]|uniref:MBL fold metallo-hydrolase n=1 Tax=Kineococcus indalonis TaxID=2696566 RepID=UPI0014136A68|nr:MBL fold metallo-hydrolase [Kineococcus indalonis]NAZ85655.1 MBL fold metallo-hydrolase [Kineococcus indalonis]